MKTNTLKGPFLVGPYVENDYEPAYWPIETFLHGLLEDDDESVSISADDGPEASFRYAAAVKRWPKFKTRCTRCGDVCIVKPLFPTTKAERETMARDYVCGTCGDTRVHAPASGVSREAFIQAAREAFAP